MAFAEYRNPCKQSTEDEFDFERFAYDVFAYMLRICGFPEANIRTSSLKANNYIDANFVRNVGLSALPIALYTRDNWRLAFKLFYEESGLANLRSVKALVESMLEYSEAFKEEDTLSKIQFSLAFLTELTLFLNFIGVETYFVHFPRLWSRLCKDIVAESEYSDKTIVSLFTMYPDISESWIVRFIRKFAIPYESSNGVSDKFFSYTFGRKTDIDALTSEPSTKNVAAPIESVPHVSRVSDEYSVTSLPENITMELNVLRGESSGHPQTSEGSSSVENESVPRVSRISDEYSVTSLPENVNMGLNYLPGGFVLPGSSGHLQTSEASSSVENESVPRVSRISDEYSVTSLPENINMELNYSPGGFVLPGSSGHLQTFEGSSPVETITFGRNTNGLNYVKRQVLKKRKRSSPQKLEVEDDFVKMYLGNEDISLENREKKRPRTLSGQDSHE